MGSEWKKWLKKEAMLADGLDEAIIGVTITGHAIYDVGKASSVLVKRDMMEPADALEYVLFNCVGAYVGEGTPLWVESIQEWGD